MSAPPSTPRRVYRNRNWLQQQMAYRNVAPANEFNPLRSLRGNYVANTTIESEYRQRIQTLNAGVLPEADNSWIHSREFYRGALDVAGRFTGIIRNPDENTPKGVADLMTQLEILIQEKLLHRELITHVNNRPEPQRNRGIRQIVNNIQDTTYIRDGLNSELAMVFNGSDMNMFNAEFWRNQNYKMRWSYDFRRIIDHVLRGLNTLFEPDQTLNYLGQAIPRLREVPDTYRNSPSRNRPKGYIYKMESHPDYLKLLFALVMVRLPSLNTNQGGIWQSTFCSFPMIRPVPDSANGVVPFQRTLSILYTNANLRSMFYFIPEQQRVIGIWPNEVKVYNEDVDDAQSFGQQKLINYNFQMIRSILCKVTLHPDDVADRSKINWNLLFDDALNNIYSKVRRSNPFNQDPAIDPYVRLFTSMTVYGNGQDTILYIPWTIEAVDQPLANDRLPDAPPQRYDIRNFIAMFIKIITEKPSGTDFVTNDEGIIILYFYFCFIREEPEDYYRDNLPNLEPILNPIEVQDDAVVDYHVDVAPENNVNDGFDDVVIDVRPRVRAPAVIQIPQQDLDDFQRENNLPVRPAPPRIQRSRSESHLSRMGIEAGNIINPAAGVSTRSQTRAVAQGPLTRQRARQIRDRVVPPRNKRARTAQTASRIAPRKSNFGGVKVGAPYAGTPKERLFLHGSMVNRFTISDALFETPHRKSFTCLMMSLIRCQMYKYSFNEMSCDGIFVTNGNKPENTTLGKLVECVNDYSNVPRVYPFLTKLDGKMYIHLFNNTKYSDNGKFLPGARDETEIQFWEQAAEEIWVHLERYKKRSIDFTQMSDYGQAFCDFFGVCISIYDIELRGNRVAVMSPFGRSPAELAKTEKEILMLHVVFDQGHIHAINNLRSFIRSKGRKSDLRIHNYCPICDKKQCCDLVGTKEESFAHINKCVKDKEVFTVGWDKEVQVNCETQFREVQMVYKKVRGKVEPTFQCRRCFQPVEQMTFAKHVCYVQTKKDDPLIDEKIYVYDLECAQITDEFGLLKHECNCLYVRKVYCDNELETQGSYFPSEIEFIEELLANPVYEGATFIAHNGGSYDIHFLLRIFERGEVEHSYVPAPTSKHKFISISLIEKNIRFIDFMRFVPGSLRSIAESFNVSVSKGDFPHKFNNGSHCSYVGPIPPLNTEDDWWGINESRSHSAKEEFQAWFTQQESVYCTCPISACSCTKMKWDFQHEIKKYCLLDVVVLAEIVKCYRYECQNFEGIGDEIAMYPDSRVEWTPPSLDPLQFMTLPQITMQTLIHGFGKEFPPEYGFKGIVTHHQSKRGGVCSDAILWLERQSSIHNEAIIHRGNSLREYYDFQLQMGLDGYCFTSHTAYLFFDCKYWACPRCYHELHESNSMIEGRGLLAEEVQDQFEKMMYTLTQSYKNVRTIWQHDFHNSFYDPYLIKCSELMNVEECFYGGRTEVFQLYCNASKMDGPIEYYDVTSLYPSIYAHHPLPVGIGCHLMGPYVDKSRFHPTASNRYFGYARVSVIPRRTDILGLLPQRDHLTGRLSFPIHPMTGCWGTEELYLAMQNGYEVTHIYELYHWEEDQRSDQHLRGYVGYFLRMKQENEGWKKLGASSDRPSPEEQEEISIRLYHQNGCLAKIRPEKVAKNAVKRQLAKLYLNALWGKFAQRPSKLCHTTIYGVQQFYQLWEDKSIDQKSCLFREISPGVFKVSYTKKQSYIDPVKHGNLFVAAKVTESARCVLHKQMLKVGPERVIYCDTDSIIFVKENNGEVLTGVGLGKWTNEYPNHIILHVYALAPKLYSLKLAPRQGDSYEVFRAKGIQMSLINQDRMSFDRIKPLIESVICGENETYTISVKNFNIFSNSGNSALPYGQIYSRYNEKKVRAIITKRIVKRMERIDWENIHEIRTFPIGYEMEE